MFFAKPDYAHPNTVCEDCLEGKCDEQNQLVVTSFFEPRFNNADR